MHVNQQHQAMSIIVKDEQYDSPEQSELNNDANGLARKSMSKKREKIVVPIQPRNANGTFAACTNMLDEEP